MGSALTTAFVGSPAIRHRTQSESRLVSSLPGRRQGDPVSKRQHRPWQGREGGHTDQRLVPGRPCWKRQVVRGGCMSPEKWWKRKSRAVFALARAWLLRRTTENVCCTGSSWAWASRRASRASSVVLGQSGLAEGTHATATRTRTSRTSSRTAFHRA